VPDGLSHDEADVSLNINPIIMNHPFHTLQEAIAHQESNLVRSETTFPDGLRPKTGIDVIDRIQFYSPGIAWLIIAENHYLDDYEENVTQYGLNTAGHWVAISECHCSCYGWPDGEVKPEEYPSLEILLAADPHAGVIRQHWATLLTLYPFLEPPR
jgi:hypothetical protein